MSGDELYDIAAQAGGGLRKVLDGDVDRLSVFGAFLDRLASEPSLALIEDLHRADEATRDFLRFIARRSFARAA